MLCALDVVVHVHQVADGAYFVGDVGIAVDGVLDGAAGQTKDAFSFGAVSYTHLDVYKRQHLVRC